MSDQLHLPPEGFRTRGPAPSGTRLVLIRHGEAECNFKGLVGGPLGDGGLTELGVHQAEALRDRFARSEELSDAVALYTSTLPRAIETGAIIASALPSGLVAKAEENLCELDPGQGDGLTWPEFVQRFGAPNWDDDPSTPIAPGGESWTGFFARCEAALHALALRHYGQLVVVVSHGGVVEQALKMVFNSGAGARLRLRTENCSMTEIEWRTDVWHLLRYNDRAPLDKDLSASYTSYVEFIKD